MCSPRRAREKARTLFLSLLFTALFFCGSGRGAAQSFSTGEDEFVVRPHPCWTMTMEFYDPAAFPYYGVDGYFFDANPFLGYRYVTSTDRILMRSSKAAPGGTSFTGLYPLRDMSGRKIWTDARILVQCYKKESLFGLISTLFAVVVHEYGSVEDARTACGGGDPPATAVDYQPYDPYAEGDDEPCEGGGSGGGDSEDSGSGTSGNCVAEWLIVEQSDDGGATWYVIYEGWGTVCD